MKNRIQKLSAFVLVGTLLFSSCSTGESIEDNESLSISSAFSSDLVSSEPTLEEIITPYINDGDSKKIKLVENLLMDLELATYKVDVYLSKFFSNYSEEIPTSNSKKDLILSLNGFSNHLIQAGLYYKANQDYSTAMEWFQWATGEGNQDASFFYNLALKSSGRESDVDWNIIVSTLENNYPYQFYSTTFSSVNRYQLLSQCYREGLGTEIDLEKANFYDLKAGISGNVKSYLQWVENQLSKVNLADRERIALLSSALEILLRSDYTTNKTWTEESAALEKELLTKYQKELEIYWKNGKISPVPAWKNAIETNDYFPRQVVNYFSETAFSYSFEQSFYSEEDSLSSPQPNLSYYTFFTEMQNDVTNGLPPDAPEVKEQVLTMLNEWAHIYKPKSIDWANPPEELTEPSLYFYDFDGDGVEEIFDFASQGTAHGLFFLYFDKNDQGVYEEKLLSNDGSYNYCDFDFILFDEKIYFSVSPGVYDFKIVFDFDVFSIDENSEIHTMRFQRENYTPLLLLDQSEESLSSDVLKAAEEWLPLATEASRNGTLLPWKDTKEYKQLEIGTLDSSDSILAYIGDFTNSDSLSYFISSNRIDGFQNNLYWNRFFYFYTSIEKVKGQMIKPDFGERGARGNAVAYFDLSPSLVQLQPISVDSVSYILALSRQNNTYLLEIFCITENQANRLSTRLYYDQSIVGYVFDGDSLRIRYE